MVVLWTWVRILEYGHSSWRKRVMKFMPFEPSPRPYRFLMDNAPPNVHVFNLALGSNEGEAELKLHERSEYDSLVSENVGFSGKTVKVKVKTLDSLKLENVGLIKIDTEGFELPVILGARETILKWKPRIIVEVHKPFREQTSEIKALLKKLGYKVKVKHKLGTYQPMLICDPN
ncbi:MAG: FkbM family methyltransferase [Thermoproteota archaeon]